jgi:hypothetical protein
MNFTTFGNARFLIIVSGVVHLLPLLSTRNQIGTKLILGAVDARYF